MRRAIEAATVILRFCGGVSRSQVTQHATGVSGLPGRTAIQSLNSNQAIPTGRRYCCGALARDRSSVTGWGKPYICGSPATPGDLLYARVQNALPLLHTAGPTRQSVLQVRFAAAQRITTGLKKYKPTTPGFRGRVITTREGLWTGKPWKQLTFGLRKTGGRSRTTGRISSWHRGGGHKRLYRMVDFKRRLDSREGEVVRLEYDPNRSARIALVRYPPKEKGEKETMAYVLAPQNVGPGSVITSSAGAKIAPGNTLPLTDIPLGTAIHNVELLPGRGGQLARAAGTSATLISRGADGYAVVKLPSGAQRRVLARCLATVGALSNALHKNRKLGKAGASRWLGRRPVVRGVAMNPVDHPHGGGRGKSKGRISQTPWGKPTKGHKTRKKRNITDTFIHLSRHDAKKRNL